MKRVNKMASGNNDFLLQIIDVFIETTPIEIGRMKERLKMEDWHGLQQVAHKLKPNVTLFGIKELESVVSQIETIASGEKHKQYLASLIEHADHLYHGAIDELQQEKKYLLRD